MFHARFSAKERTYKYVIFNRISAPTIEKDRGWHIVKKLDTNLMKKGSKKLIGKHDFSFRSSSCSSKISCKNDKYILRSKIIKDKIEIKFTSQSFLQQVRSMVGCLKYLAEKKWNFKKFAKNHEIKKRKNYVHLAPPHGLFLEKLFINFSLLLIANFLLIRHLDSTNDIATTVLSTTFAGNCL